MVAGHAVAFPNNVQHYLDKPSISNQFVSADTVCDLYRRLEQNRKSD
jgi:hypothetical protein